MYSTMLVTRSSIGRWLRCALCGITSTARGVIAMLTSESTNVMSGSERQARLRLARELQCDRRSRYCGEQQDTDTCVRMKTIGNATPRSPGCGTTP